MKVFSIYLVLLIAVVYGADVREALHTATAIPDNLTVVPQNNYNGWVNPEDLAPMPQCIAQQDQSAWLSAMTKCTSKRCTSHFTFICTHHQWLTDLSCLSVEFSSDVIKRYLPYCARSILAKEQLYQWTHKITGRTWLVDVGDTIDLEGLSPASLAAGYAAVEETFHAPTCLTGSVSAVSQEPFQHVMASCGFTSITQHTGNADRPWEYSESLHSMIPLDSQTVGYDLIPRGMIHSLFHRGIKDGDYFDKDCFCSNFKINFNNEPCSGPGELDFTKERLWINAICGPSLLPENWTDSLKTTGFEYIPIDNWHWPKCVADMSKQVLQRTDQCATDACDVDSDGYCKVRRAVDRACVCRHISYDSCGGSCHVFETRIDYVKWLHGLCGDVQDWRGLPNNWSQLAAPTPVEMIPWGWTLSPFFNSNPTNGTRSGYQKTAETCPTNDWKLGSFALVNIAIFLAVLVSQRIRAYQTIGGCRKDPNPSDWLFKGASIATLQLLANCINALIVQHTPGYEGVLVIQLVLLWCSMPRTTWLIMLLLGLQPFGAIDLSATASVLLGEMILQCLSFYYMIITVNYGRGHNFYLGAIGDVERGGPAKAMYAGALLWLMLFILVLVQSMRAKRKINKLTGSTTVEEVTSAWNENRINSKDGIAQSSKDNAGTEKTPLTRTERHSTAYGTFSDPGQQHWVSQNAFVELCVATAMGMLFLWVAQWLFWGGFVGLSLEEYVLVHLFRGYC
ncbi:hypothetical protein P170DRAFT_370267 [Aspergillus steynii IBT 23096]|uniref:Integral membrane protein n=1 Tax=Aspergillus steynii IBT 23096 TaxID=1392250 RepID=A0A2I2FRN7_9EURO|nr:uncharacterized protein P170DRAFT_370267 [Aspergillus steynii IBT 23096]PLB43277.1 hypothetical protein P170DRAFT_370267 [Aspergillus steynii IBT 23096]